MLPWEAVGRLVVAFRWIAMVIGFLAEGFGVIMMSSYRLRRTLGQTHPMDVHGCGVWLLLLGIAMIWLGGSMAGP